MNWLRHFCVTFLLVGICGAVAADENRFESPPAGVALSKPESWVFASVETALEWKERLRWNDAQLKEWMKGQATPPLAVVTKFPEPHEGVNPSFQLGLRPLGVAEGMSAEDVLKAVVPGFDKMFTDFEIVKNVHAVEVGGLPGARATFLYSLILRGGDTFPILGDSLIVPRGKMMFFIGMARLRDDAAAGVELEQILESVEIQP